MDFLTQIAVTGEWHCKISAKPLAEKSWRKKILHGGYPGTVDKVVTGTFSGVFHWNPENHPPRSFDVQLIENVAVETKKPAN